MAEPNARGERTSEGRWLVPLAAVAVTLVVLAVAITVAILPHRVERPSWNAASWCRD